MAQVGEKKKSLLDKPAKKSLEERAKARIDLRAELSRLEQAIEELKIEYEQFFLGFRPFAPDKLHQEVKRLLRAIMKAPFKSSEMSYRIKALESRYSTYNTYWQRINKQREEGTYSKDVFKANLRERNALEDARGETAAGKADKNMQALFNSYKSALEKQTGKKQQLDYKAFRTSLVKRAKDFKKTHGNKKLSFKVTVKKGKVSVMAKAKD